MKIELKHLAPYLPYKLKICYRILDLENGNPNTNDPNDRLMDYIMIMDGDRLDRYILLEKDRWYDKNSVFKPMLLPLSELKKDHKSGVCYVIENIVNNSNNHCDAYDEWLESYLNNPIAERLLQAPYEIIEMLFESHYDVFGLIDAGLAISKTTATA